MSSPKPDWEAKLSFAASLPGLSGASGSEFVVALAERGHRSLNANENPLYGIDSIPFLATSFDDSEKLWKAASDKIKAALDADNLVYIYAVPWPPQGLYTKKDTNSAADLRGIKFRAYNTQQPGGRIAPIRLKYLERPRT